MSLYIQAEKQLRDQSSHTEGKCYNTILRIQEMQAGSESSLVGRSGDLAFSTSGVLDFGRSSFLAFFVISVLTASFTCSRSSNQHHHHDSMTSAINLRIALPSLMKTPQHRPKGLDAALHVQLLASHQKGYDTQL